MELERSRVDVGEVCRETVLDFYQILTRQEIRVEAEIPEGAVWGCCDREALRRILNNLISNAVRYGGDGGYLGVSRSGGAGVPAPGHLGRQPKQRRGERTGAVHRQRAGPANGRRH